MYISSKFATGVKTTNNENDLANGLLVLQCVLLTFSFSSQVSLLKESGVHLNLWQATGLLNPDVKLLLLLLPITPPPPWQKSCGCCCCD